MCRDMLGEYVTQRIMRLPGLRSSTITWVAVAFCGLLAWTGGAAAAGPENRPLPFPRVATGDSLRAKGDVTRAEAEYRAALEIAKDYQAGTSPREDGICLANYGLARLALLRKQPGAARDLLKSCKDKPKFEGQYLLGMGLAALAEDNLDEAETFLIQGASRMSQTATPGAQPDPLRLEIVYTLVDVAEAKGVPGLAVNHVDEIISLRPNDPAPLIKKGRLLVITRQYDEALKAFSKAVKIDSTSIEAYREVGILFTRAKRPAEAAKALDKLVKYEPTAANYQKLGEANLAARQPAEALAAYEQALKLEPTSDAAQLGLARSASLKGDNERALAAYQAVKDASVLGPEDQENIGRAHLDRKEYPAAREAYLKAVALDSTRTDARYYVGYSYFVEQKFTEAIPYFEARIAADSTWAPAYGNLGIALLQSGQAARGLEMLEKAVQIQPDDSSNRVLLAQALMSQSQFARAATEFQSVIDREPENPDALRGLGYCLLQQGRYNDAIAALSKANSVQPGNVQGMVALAQAHGMAGQLAQAKTIFRQVLAVDPGNSDARDGIDAIDKATPGKKRGGS